jgi:hypothetical protein
MSKRKFGDIERAKLASIKDCYHRYRKKVLHLKQQLVEARKEYIKDLESFGNPSGGLGSGASLNNSKEISLRNRDFEVEELNCNKTGKGNNLIGVSDVTRPKGTLGRNVDDIYKDLEAFFPCDVQWVRYKGAGSCMAIAVKVTHSFMVVENISGLENKEKGWSTMLSFGIELFGKWKSKYEADIKPNRKDISPYAEITDILEMDICKGFLNSISLVRYYTSELPRRAGSGGGYVNTKLEDAVNRALDELSCERVCFVPSIISDGSPYTVCFCVYRTPASKKIEAIYLFDSHGGIQDKKSTLLKTKKVEAICDFLKDRYQNKVDEIKVNKLALLMKTGELTTEKEDNMRYEEEDLFEVNCEIRYTMAVFVLSNSKDARDTKNLIRAGE